MTKKTIFLILIGILYFNTSLGQIGVNTENPTSSLDVNGSIGITDNLLVGGDDNTKGSAGTKGQFLISKGEGFAPEWQTIESLIIPSDTWTLLSSISKTDNQGGLVIPMNITSSASAYTPSYTIYKVKTSTTNLWDFANRPWYEFEDLAFTIPPTKDSIRIVVNLQLLAQAAWPVTGIGANIYWMSYAVGIFKEIPPAYSTVSRTAIMLASRQGGCFGTDAEGNNTPQQLCTMIVTLELPPSDESVNILTFGTKRNESLGYAGNNSTNTYLTLGSNLKESTIDESFIRQATMRIDIYGKAKKE